MLTCHQRDHFSVKMVNYWQLKDLIIPPVKGNISITSTLHTIQSNSDSTKTSLNKTEDAFHSLWTPMITPKSWKVEYHFKNCNSVCDYMYQQSAELKYNVDDLFQIFYKIDLNQADWCHVLKVSLEKHNCTGKLCNKNKYTWRRSQELC